MSDSDPPKTPFKALTRARQWLVALGIITLCIALSYFVGEVKGAVSGASIGVIAMLIMLAWPLRKQSWFRALVALFIALHSVGGLELDWSWVATERSGLKGRAALFTPDLLIMYGITYAIYRLKYGTPAESVEASIDDLPRYGDRDLGF